VTDKDWPAGPAIVVSDDEPRGGVLAAQFSDAYLTRPGANRVSPPGATPASHLVVLAGVDAARALSELLPRLSEDATLLVETAGDEDPSVGGWHARGVREVAGLRFVELGRSTDPAPGPATEMSSGPAGTEPAEVTGTGGDGMRPAELQTLTEAASGSAVRADPPAPPSPATPAASAAASRRSRLLLLAGGTGIACLAVALVVALVTTTGYVGFAVTLVALVALGGLAALAWLQQRSARTVQAALGRIREKDRAARARAQKQLSTATSSLQTRTAALDARLATLERDLHVVAASTLETARRLPEPRTPETFTDPHELTSMHQTQAIANLFALVPTSGVVPFMGGWAASPDLVLMLVGEVLSRRPALVVECGSGVSTLWLSLVIDHYGLETRIVSLDHDPVYAEQTRQTLRDHGVAHVAEVRDAPLAPTGLPGHDTPWYSLEAVEDLHDIGLLFVDGPPDATGPLVRLPAVPVLKDRLAARASVVLDDVIRAAEQEVTSRWATILPDFTLTHLSLQKDASRFRRG
jgi:predicted O-methyltransferase YrrM